MCEVEWEYVPIGEFYPGPGPGQDGYVVLNTSSVAELRDVYRTGPSSAGIDATGNVTNLWADIGGQSIDIGGKPTSHPMPKTTYQILEHRSGPINTFPFESFVGYRNSTAFSTAPPNFALYVGTQTVAIGPNIFALVHEMILDGFMHLTQVPVFDQDNKPLTIPVSPAAPVSAVQRRAFPVVWRQIFPNRFDFHTLSPHFGGF